jgi:hypothetical protein
VPLGLGFEVRAKSLDHSGGRPQGPPADRTLTRCRNWGRGFPGKRSKAVTGSLLVELAEMIRSASFRGVRVHWVVSDGFRHCITDGDQTRNVQRFG